MQMTIVVAVNQINQRERHEFRTSCYQHTRRTRSNMQNTRSVRITYTNVFSHLRSRDRKLRIFSKPELNITSPFFQKKNKATLNLKLTFATITEVSGLLNNNEITEKMKNRSAQLMKMISTVLKFKMSILEGALTTLPLRVTY